MSDPTDGSSERSQSRTKGAICYETEVNEQWSRVRLANNADRPLEEFATTRKPDGYEYADPLPTYLVPAISEQYSHCGTPLEPRFCSWCATPDTVGRVWGRIPMESKVTERAVTLTGFSHSLWILLHRRPNL